MVAELKFKLTHDSAKNIFGGRTKQDLHGVSIKMHFHNYQRFAKIKIKVVIVENTY